MIVFGESKKSTLDLCVFLLSALVECPPSFASLILKHCDVVAVRGYGGSMFMPVVRPMVLLSARDEAGGLAVRKAWHEGWGHSDNLHRIRVYKEHEAPLAQEIMRLEHSQSMSLMGVIGVALDATDKGVDRGSEEMRSIIDDANTEVTRQRLDMQLQVDKLKAELAEVQSQDPDPQYDGEWLLHGNVGDLGFLTMQPIVDLIPRNEVYDYCTKFQCKTYTLKAGRDDRAALKVVRDLKHHLKPANIHFV